MVWSQGVASVVVVVLGVAIVISGRKVGVVKFQTGDVATTESFLDTGLDGLPTLRQVTLVVHLRLRRITSHIPLLNYAVQGSNEELFVELVPKKKDMHVQCCGGLVSEAFKFKMRMFTWQHISISLDLHTRVLHVVYDDLEYRVDLEEPASQGIGSQWEIRGGGRLVVGQKLYSLEGDFIVLETLDGEISDYRLYDVALPPSQMNELLQCRDIPELMKPLIDLEDNKFEVKGPTTTRNISLEEICGNHVTGFYLFFSQKTIFQRAYSWCRKLTGNLILPEDSETNAYFFDRFIKYKDQCDDIWTHLFWIGSGGNLTTRQWLKLTDNTPITWYHFLREYRTVTPEFQCIAAVTHDKYKWAACPCEIETCVLCNFTTHPKMRLRGLCKNTAFDRLFSFRDNENFELVFDGLAHVVMRRENESWVMKSRLYEGLKATMMVQSKGEYPVGVHTWLVDGDRCRHKEVKLLLTSCNVDEYTCDDGSCIGKTRRCDLSVDCDDQSDEMNCDVVLVPLGYSSGLPPPTLMGKPVPILFSLNVTSIREFSLVTFSISMDVFLMLKWQDRRLKFSNLQDNFRANKLKDLKDVWTPQMKVQDGTLSAVQARTHSQTVYVAKTAKPLQDDDTTIREDIVYSGSENMLIYQHEETVSYKCHFKLQLYPFDRQLCFVVYRIQDVTQDLGVLKKDGEGIQFLGSRQLLEYTLISETFKNYTLHDVSHIKIEFAFRNQYGYYIGNTFLPSVMLAIICWVTLHFDIADFQDRIMVSLTSLLVLATVFTQTSQSIPKTSYLKLIDVWFVVLISEDFAIIVSLVYIEVLRLRHPTNTIKVVPVGSVMAWDTVVKRIKTNVDDDEISIRELRNRRLSMNRDESSSPVPDHQVSPMDRDDSHSPKPVPVRALKVNRILLNFFSVTLFVLILCFVAMCIFSIISK